MEDKGHGEKKIIIGLTGMYCAGKNYIAALLEARGIPVLDVDKLGYRAIEEEREAILTRFGREVLSASGQVDRKKLGALVFDNPGELAALESIVHPGANRLTGQWIGEQGGPCVINAALLHRSSAFERLDAIILVKAPALVRFGRARKRDGLPWGELFRRFWSQRNFISQYLRGKTDIYTIYNSPFRTDPRRQLETIILRIGMVT
ncbi:MAG: dephospho-CoA kinase [Treponema sp.]|nr:dephospho-CoA kinase [Treponema sp.]